jgi:hypothetical protein
VALDVEAVLQAQRAEFVIGQFAGFPAADLIAELLDALVDQLAVDGVVFVHERPWGGNVISKNQLAADQHKHGGQDAAQDVLRHLGGNMAADPDAGQRAEQQGAEQRPVDAAEPPVAEAGDQGQRYGVGDVGSDNRDRRKFWVEEEQRGDAQRAGAD